MTKSCKTKRENLAAGKRDTEVSKAGTRVKANDESGQERLSEPMRTA